MCDFCEKGMKCGDFDGNTYFEVRVDKYFGFPAALFMFKNAFSIAGFGIYNCPMCGRDLRMKGEERSRSKRDALDNREAELESLARRMFLTWKRLDLEGDWPTSGHNGWKAFEQRMDELGLLEGFNHD